MTIPAGGCVELTRRATHYLLATELSAAVPNTGQLPVMFRFSTPDGQSFTIGTVSQPVELPVSVPESPLPRKS